MHSESEYELPEVERSLPAWAFSLLVHASAMVFVMTAIQLWPEPGGNGGDGSIEVVMLSDADRGPLRNGDEGQGDRPRNPYAVVAPPELLPSIPTPPQTPPQPPSVVQQTLPTPLAATPLVREQPQQVPMRLAAAPMLDANATQQNAARPAASGGIGRSGKPGGDGSAKTSVFGVEGRGTKFVYLFDRSASMDGAPLSAAKKQLIESLKSLDGVHQFQIIFFNSTTQIFDAAGTGKRIVFASDRNKQLAWNFVGGITADGGTDRMVALRDALAMGPNVIFFLTDADDPMSPTELAEVDRLNHRAATKICVIEFGRGPMAPQYNFLMQLARETGGKYGYVDTTKLGRSPK
jgi:hypothetical protein